MATEREIGGDIEMNTNVHWRDTSGRFLAGIDDAGERAVKETVKEGVELAVKFAPKRSRKLSLSIHPFYSGGGFGGWVMGTGYGLAQEKGARRHPIGDEGQVLANKEQEFFAIGPVDHPGNPAVRFMARSYEIASKSLMRRIKAHAPG